MDSGGASGVPTSDASPQLVAELKAAKQLAAAAQSERDQARRALTHHQKRPRATGNGKGRNASDPSTGWGKGAKRGGNTKRAKKGGGKGIF